MYLKGKQQTFCQCQHESNNLQCLFGLFESGKKHDSGEEKEKTRKKTTFENDSDDTIPEGVSKLNKMAFFDDTDRGSLKFVV